MSGNPITVDMDTLKLIAEASAAAAAKQVSEDLRTDMRTEFAELEKRMGDRLDSYFGKTDPSKHIVQHDRIDRLLKLFDRMGENIFTNILKQLLWGLIVVGVVGYLLWHKFTGLGA